MDPASRRPRKLCLRKSAQKSTTPPGKSMKKFYTTTTDLDAFLILTATFLFMFPKDNLGKYNYHDKLYENSIKYCLVYNFSILYQMNGIGVGLSNTDILKDYSVPVTQSAAGLRNYQFIVIKSRSHLAGGSIAPRSDDWLR